MAWRSGEGCVGQSQRGVLGVCFSCARETCRREEERKKGSGKKSIYRPLIFFSLLSLSTTGDKDKEREREQNKRLFFFPNLSRRALLP
jgi:hypothetical protein